MDEIYICKYCNKICKNSNSLRNHQRLCKNNPNCDLKSLDILHKNIKKWNDSHHKAWNKGLTKETDKRIAKLVNTRHKRYLEGTLPKEAYIHSVSVETRAKIATGTKRYLDKHGKLYKARFSEKGCAYIEKLNADNNWHLQHALNGGEISVGPYYVDGYDKDLNIAFEYDEPKHYKDVEDNILTDRDISRMNYIKEKLKCRFFRYNEKIKLFYEA